MYIEGLDELDNKIINVVKDNARLTYSEIGEKVGVSRISVRKRMEALEEKGIIQGYKAVIDPTKVPEGVRFINLQRRSGIWKLISFIYQIMHFKD